MNNIFGHCRDSFWTILCNLDVFVNFGVGLVELRVYNWISRLIIGAHGCESELEVENWSSRFKFGAHGSRFGVHGFDLELMAQRVSIMNSFFWACRDNGFWASCDKGFWVTRVFCAHCDVFSFLSISKIDGTILTCLKGEGTLCYII